MNTAGEDARDPREEPRRKPRRRRARRASRARARGRARARVERAAKPSLGRAGVLGVLLRGRGGVSGSGVSSSGGSRSRPRSRAPRARARGGRGRSPTRPSRAFGATRSSVRPGTGARRRRGVSEEAAPARWRGARTFSSRALARPRQSRRAGASRGSRRRRPWVAPLELGGVRGGGGGGDDAEEQIFAPLAALRQSFVSDTRARLAEGRLGRGGGGRGARRGRGRGRADPEGDEGLAPRVPSRAPARTRGCARPRTRQRAGERRGVAGELGRPAHHRARRPGGGRDARAEGPPVRGEPSGSAPTPPRRAPCGAGGQRRSAGKPSEVESGARARRRIVASSSAGRRTSYSVRRCFAPLPTRVRVMVAAAPSSRSLVPSSRPPLLARSSRRSPALAPPAVASLRRRSAPLAVAALAPGSSALSEGSPGRAVVGVPASPTQPPPPRLDPGPRRGRGLRRASVPGVGRAPRERRVERAQASGEGDAGPRSDPRRGPGDPGSRRSLPSIVPALPLDRRAPPSPLFDRCTYLDYNATTPIFPEVAAAMGPFVWEHFAQQRPRVRPCAEALAAARAPSQTPSSANARSSSPRAAPRAITTPSRPR